MSGTIKFLAVDTSQVKKLNVAFRCVYASLLEVVYVRLSICLDIFDIYGFNSDQCQNDLKQK